MVSDSARSGEDREDEVDAARTEQAVEEDRPESSRPKHKGAGHAADGAPKHGAAKGGAGAAEGPEDGAGDDDGARRSLAQEGSGSEEAAEATAGDAGKHAKADAAKGDGEDEDAAEQPDDMVSDSARSGEDREDEVDAARTEQAVEEDRPESSRPKHKGAEHAADGASKHGAARGGAGADGPEDDAGDDDGARPSLAQAGSGSEQAEEAASDGSSEHDIPTDFPLYEGFPQVAADLFPQRKLPELAEVETEAGEQYGVRFEQPAVPNWGGNCGGPYRASVYLPTGFPYRAPLVIFSHGFGQGGPRVDRWLGPGFLRELAKQGFVVVAHQTGLNNWCDTGVDQLKSLQWVRTSKYAGKIDFSRVSFWGYSMGAYFCSHRTGNRNQMNAMNVKTAVLLMGPCQYGCGKPEIPAFWGAGGADTSSPANQIKHAFNVMDTGQAKVYKLVPGAPHTEVGAGGHNRFLVPAIQHMRCHFYNSGPNCDAVYNSQNPHYKP